MKSVFDAGGLKSVVITRAPMVTGYRLIFKDNHNKSFMMTAQRADKLESRVFKSMDATVTNAVKVGFNRMAVECNLA
ncbi:plasmid replication protein RepB [Shewanella vesiculosa]|uniref:plasmid replication protein RepB n=1 Tax=Shewanella vesiculosa TaxID=518738 RepID=UPI003D072059